MVNKPETTKDDTPPLWVIIPLLLIAVLIVAPIKVLCGWMPR